jgi:cytochrome d ubiquinol oxidase subunit II
VSFEAWLPVVFMGLMGLALLIYVALDGYDLGVGMLMSAASPEERDTMVASIGPFWDANETWLVLGASILLTAFPKANGLVLTALYLPVVLMLIGLVLRGVAFDFRIKAQDEHRAMWNRAFIAGSALASAAQGWMAGRYVSGLREGWRFDLFAAAIAFALPSAYLLLGACWLILKTEGALQARAIGWAKRAWPFMVAGFVLISIITPWVSPTVRARWFVLPEFALLLPIPLLSAAALVALRRLLDSPGVRGRRCGLPFLLLVLVLVLGFAGLAYSLYPYVVMDRLTLWQAASSPAALEVLLAGVVVAVPPMVAYTVIAYRVFGGKATALDYG